ncbi:hypothetical protein D3C87_325180 [compost metagenome]
MFWNYVKVVVIFAILTFITISVVGLLGMMLQKIVVYTLVGAAMLTILAMVWEACFAKYEGEIKHD